MNPEGFQVRARLQAYDFSAVPRAACGVVAERGAARAGVWGKMVGTGVRWTVARLLFGRAWRAGAAGKAETLESALAQAYRNNPTLNAQRARVRAIDESVPQALSGYRPRVN